VSVTTRDGATYGQLLSHPVYRPMWVVQVINQVGDAVTRTALPVYVYMSTGSAVALSLTLAMQYAALMIVGPVAGVIVDRADRKRMLIAINAIRAFLVVMLVWVNAMWQIYLIQLISSCLAAAYLPTHSSVMLQIIPRRLYLKAATVAKVTTQITSTCGPALGAVLLAYIGPVAAFAVDSLSFAVAAVVLAVLTLPRLASDRAPSHATARPPFMKSAVAEFLGGVSFLRQQPVLLFMTVMQTLRGIGGTMPAVVLVVYVGEVAAAPASMYGWVMAMASAGLVIGSIGISFAEGKLARHVVLSVGSIIGGLALVPFAVGLPMSAVMALMLLSNVALGAAFVVENVYFAELTPTELRGRVYSAARAVLAPGELLSMAVLPVALRILSPQGAMSVAGLAIAAGFLAPAWVMRGYKMIVQGRVQPLIDR